MSVAIEPWLITTITIAGGALVAFLAVLSLCICCFCYRRQFLDCCSRCCGKCCGCCNRRPRRGLSGTVNSIKSSPIPEHIEYTPIPDEKPLDFHPLETVKQILIDTPYARKLEPLPALGSSNRIAFLTVDAQKRPFYVALLPVPPTSRFPFSNPQAAQALCTVLTLADHPNVLPTLVAHYRPASSHLLLLRPWSPMGSLRDMITSTRPALAATRKRTAMGRGLPLKTTQLILRQVVRGLLYLRERGLRYYHLTATNVIMFKPKGKQPPVAMLTDYENHTAGIESAALRGLYESLRGQGLQPPGPDVVGVARLAFEMITGHALNRFEDLSLYGLPNPTYSVRLAAQPHILGPPGCPTPHTRSAWLPNPTYSVRLAAQPHILGPPGCPTPHTRSAWLPNPTYSPQPSFPPRPPPPPPHVRDVQFVWDILRAPGLSVEQLASHPYMQAELAPAPPENPPDLSRDLFYQAMQSLQRKLGARPTGPLAAAPAAAPAGGWSWGGAAGGSLTGSYGAPGAGLAMAAEETTGAEPDAASPRAPQPPAAAPGPAVPPSPSPPSLDSPMMGAPPPPPRRMLAPRPLYVTTLPRNFKEHLRSPPPDEARPLLADLPTGSEEQPQAALDAPAEGDNAASSPPPAVCHRVLIAWLSCAPRPSRNPCCEIPAAPDLVLQSRAPNGAVDVAAAANLIQKGSSKQQLPSITLCHYISPSHTGNGHAHADLRSDSFQREPPRTSEAAPEDPHPPANRTGPQVLPTVAAAAAAQPGDQAIDLNHLLNFRDQEEHFTPQTPVEFPQLDVSPRAGVDAGAAMHPASAQRFSWSRGSLTRLGEVWQREEFPGHCGRPGGEPSAHWAEFLRPPRIGDPVPAPDKATSSAGGMPVLAPTSDSGAPVDSWWEESPACPSAALSLRVLLPRHAPTAHPAPLTVSRPHLAMGRHTMPPLGCGPPVALFQAPCPPPCRGGCLSPTLLPCRFLPDLDDCAPGTIPNSSLTCNGFGAYFREIRKPQTPKKLNVGPENPGEGWLVQDLDQMSTSFRTQPAQMAAEQKN
ncbi:hypothetical protein PAPYR_11843 [Paratrimastix pyriformis]|uniref:Protein kinase domain-containing protein n=1 Tax=Paratrimastix pyriformis TaxID=342808 RepID=A0ABQ8U8F6_9EUKA|nr:hypothetical protein PAPYR_11843 [Paratrimastix pyriformis]